MSKYTVMNFQDTPNEWWMKERMNVKLIDNNLKYSEKYFDVSSDVQMRSNKSLLEM